MSNITNSFSCIGVKNVLVYFRCIAHIVLWCNGSTTDFGSVSIGSSPIGTTAIIFIVGYLNIY